MRPSHRTSIALAAVAARSRRRRPAQGRSRPVRRGRGSAARPSPASSSGSRVQRTVSSTRSGTAASRRPRSSRPASRPPERLSALPPSPPASTATAGSALLVMPDRTLRLFAAGATHPGSSAYGINTFTAPAGGGTLDAAERRLLGRRRRELACVIGATLTKDGQPVTAWRGFAAEGLAAELPQSATSRRHDRLAARDRRRDRRRRALRRHERRQGRRLRPAGAARAAAARVVLPLPFGENDWYSSLSGRIGAPGVYVAYADTQGGAGSTATAADRRRSPGAVHVARRPARVRRAALGRLGRQDGRPVRHPLEPRRERVRARPAARARRRRPTGSRSSSARARRVRSTSSRTFRRRLRRLLAHPCPAAARAARAGDEGKVTDLGP